MNKRDFKAEIFSQKSNCANLVETAVVFSHISDAIFFFYKPALCHWNKLSARSRGLLNILVLFIACLLIFWNSFTSIYELCVE